MNRNLSQPEEIDLILNEMAKRDMEAEVPIRDSRPFPRFSQEGWNGGYVSPYRAAYMKAHGLVP